MQTADGTLYKPKTAGPINLSTTNFSDTTLWTRVSSPGDVYRFVGASGGVDINNEDYSVTARWQRVPPSYLQSGDVYRYVGQAQTLDLNNQNYATDTADWQRVVAGAVPATYIPQTQTTTSVQVVAVENATITSVSVAAALSIAASGGAGISVAGGGSSAINTITSKTEAYIASSTLGTSGAPVSGGVTVQATDSATIVATEAAIAASVAIGAEVGAGVAIGISVAENTINDGGTGQGYVKAYVTGSDVYANGMFAVQATSSERVSAEVIAASAAISGGSAGFAVAGAGVGVTNSINVLTEADIDFSPTAIVAGAVNVNATDSSVIDAEADAAAVAAAFGAAVGAAVAIGITVAENTIDDAVTAMIQGVPSLTIAANPSISQGAGAGTVSVAASEAATIVANAHAAALAVGASPGAGIAIAGGGAVAENAIGTQTNADIIGSTLGTSSNTRLVSVLVTATDTSVIKSGVLAAAASVGIGADAGVAASIGIAVARNVIGNGTDFSSNQQ